jgi:hypothetical protein
MNFEIYNLERNCESDKKVGQIPRKDRSVKHKKCEQKNKTSWTSFVVLLCFKFVVLPCLIMFTLWL